LICHPKDSMQFSASTNAFFILGLFDKFNLQKNKRNTNDFWK
jgi:hypothetical protein